MGGSLLCYWCPPGSGKYIWGHGVGQSPLQTVVLLAVTSLHCTWGEPQHRSILPQRSLRALRCWRSPQMRGAKLGPLQGRPRAAGAWAEGGGAKPGGRVLPVPPAPSPCTRWALHTAAGTPSSHPSKQHFGAMECAGKTVCSAP